MIDLSLFQKSIFMMTIKYILPFFVIIFLVKLFWPKLKGLIGEKKMKNNLIKLPSDKYFVSNDIMIPSRSGTSQIDHVVVSQYGVFAIETKNYDGWIYGNEKDKYWTQVLNKKTRSKNS